MKKIFLFLLLTILIGIKESYSQNKELCICFEEGNPYVEIKPSKDSLFFQFSIVKPNYETEELRQKAMAEFWEKKNKHPLLILRPPIFYIDYFATEEPVELNSIKNIDCTGLVSLKDYRDPGFKRPPNTSSVSFIFIQKISEDRFLKWEVVRRAIE